MGICKRGPSPSAQDRRPAIAAVMDVPDVAAVRPNPPEMQPERRKCGVGGGTECPIGPHRMRGAKGTILRAGRCLPSPVRVDLQARGRAIP